MAQESNKNTIIAAVGENTDALFAGVREFPTEKVIFLCRKEESDLANKLVDKLKEFKVPTHVLEMKGSLWECVFGLVEQIKGLEKDKDKLMINVSTGNTITAAAMTSAAFVNGIRAFSVEDDDITMLPILKFSYYKMIPPKKMDILRLLYNKKQCCSSLDDLSKEMGMSLPLISYHVNGTKKAPGLKELGLIETKENKGRLGVQLSLQGKLLVKGYL